MWQGVYILIRTLFDLALSSLPYAARAFATQHPWMLFCPQFAVSVPVLLFVISGWKSYVFLTVQHIWYWTNIWKAESSHCISYFHIELTMGKAKKTRKFAEVKRLLNPKDAECVDTYDMVCVLPSSGFVRCMYDQPVLCHLPLQATSEKTESGPWERSPPSVSHVSVESSLLQQTHLLVGPGLAMTRLAYFCCAGTKQAQHFSSDTILN